MSASTKQPHATVLSVARRVVEGLTPFCDRVEIAGSLRRERPMVGDIEIVALPKRQVDLLGQVITNGETRLDIFLEERVKLCKNGSKYKQFKYGQFMVDLFLPESSAYWGCVYLIRTGSHEFNMWLMNHQQKQAGVKFSNGRLLNWQGHFIETPEEADVFEALKLPFIPVTMRDDNAWHEYINKWAQANAL